MVMDPFYQEVLTRLKEVFATDSTQAQPVVQSISLLFWQRLRQWVNHLVLVPEPFIVTLTGPSGSGKSFVQTALSEQLSQFTQVSAFTQDNYYRDFEADFSEIPIERFYHEVNLDDPIHICFEELKADLQRLKSTPYGASLALPKLKFGTPLRKPTIEPAALQLKATPVVITEGIHAFYHRAVLPLYDLKIYVDVEEKVRRERWLARNQLENRGVTDHMWETTVGCLNQYLLPSREVADVVLNNGVSPEQMNDFLEKIIVTLYQAQADLRKIA